MGLSNVNKPEWIYSRPELVISVNSTDHAWALAMGEVVVQNCRDSLLGYGTLINFGEKISDDSEMSGFFVWHNCLFDDGEEEKQFSD